MYSSRKSKTELLRILFELEESCNGSRRDHSIYPIYIIDRTCLRVKTRKITTKWELMLDEPGSIAVYRRRSFFDLSLILSVLAVDLLLGSVLFAGGFSSVKLMLLGAVILVQFFLGNWVLVINPLKQIERFIAKYLTGS